MLPIGVVLQGATMVARQIPASHPGKGALVCEAAPATEADPEPASGGCLLATFLQRSSQRFPKGWEAHLHVFHGGIQQTHLLLATRTILFFFYLFSTFFPSSICLLLLDLLPQIPPCPAVLRAYVFPCGCLIGVLERVPASAALLYGST